MKFAKPAFWNSYEILKRQHPVNCMNWRMSLAFENFRLHLVYSPNNRDLLYKHIRWQKRPTIYQKRPAVYSGYKVYWPGPALSCNVFLWQTADFGEFHNLYITCTFHIAYYISHLVATRPRARAGSALWPLSLAKSYARQQCIQAHFLKRQHCHKLI